VYIAAWKNYPEVANALVKAGADLNIRKEVKYTMIMLRTFTNSEWSDRFKAGWTDTVRPNQYYADYQDRFETSTLSCLSAADYELSDPQCQNGIL